MEHIISRLSKKDLNEIKEWLLIELYSANQTNKSFNLDDVSIVIEDIFANAYLNKSKKINDSFTNLIT